MTNPEEEFMLAIETRLKELPLPDYLAFGTWLYNAKDDRCPCPLTWLFADSLMADKDAADVEKALRIKIGRQYGHDALDIMYSLAEKYDDLIMKALELESTSSAGDYTSGETALECFKEAYYNTATNYREYGRT